MPSCASDWTRQVAEVEACGVYVDAPTPTGGWRQFTGTSFPLSADDGYRSSRTLLPFSLRRPSRACGKFRNRSKGRETCEALLGIPSNSPDPLRSSFPRGKRTSRKASARETRRLPVHDQILHLRKSGGLRYLVPKSCC